MVSVHYLNLIAKGQKLITPLGRYLFNLKTDNEYNAISDEHYQVLISKGYNSAVASAVNQLLPICLENIAISNYIVENDALDLRLGLPEILDANEALIYAKGDYVEICHSTQLQQQFLFLFNTLIREQQYLISQ